MAVEWVKVDNEVIELAKKVIEKWHPDLEEASIAFIFRTEAPKNGNMVVYGTASRIKPEHQLLGLDHDFLIWLAQDKWYTLTDAQKVALIDHELCHCSFNEKDKPTMVDHDIQEFACIIQRHGFWWPNPERFIEAVQAALPMRELKHTGRVEAIGKEFVDAMRRSGITGVEMTTGRG